MPPKRVIVAYVTDSFNVGGTELNAVRTVEALDHTRFDVRLFSFRLEGPLLSRYERLGIAPTQLPISGLFSRSAAEQGLRFARIIQEQGIDVLHAHDFYSNVFTASWGRLRGKARIITSRRWWRPPALSHELVCRVAYARSDAVLANCASVAELLRTRERIPARRIITIPNFVDDTMFIADDQVERRAALTAMGIPQDRPILGIVARLSSEKNHAMLLDVVSRLRTAGKPVRLLIVGDGPEMAGLRAAAASRGVEQDVVFLGYLPNSPNVHRLFDISLLSSNSEGFPNAVVEAMAAGRPVVATDVGGVKDAVVHETTGLLTKSGDAASFTAAVETLLADSRSAREMGVRGQALALERFSRTQVIGLLSEQYERLARGRAD